MDPLTISAIISGGAALGQFVTGLSQKAAAKKIAKNNKRPKKIINQEILDNQALAESRASAGLSDNAKQVYSSGAERGLTSSIDAILKGGGSVNNIADIYDSYQGGISKMSLIDEEMRSRNISALLQQNRELSGEKDTAWQVNEWGPYADKAQAAATLAKQGEDNKWKGVNTAVSAVNSWAVGQQFGKEAAGVFGSDSNMPRPGGDHIDPALGRKLTEQAKTSSTMLDPIWINGQLVDPVTRRPIF